MTREEKKKLPEGWQWVRLGEVCVVDWGNTNLTKKSYEVNGKFLAVSAAGCDGRIDHSEHKKSTLVLSAIGNCGKVFLPDEDFTAIKNTITLTPKISKCNAKFLYYLLSNANFPQRGAVQPFISKGDVQDFIIPHPPLAEQERIVARLDGQLAVVEKARLAAEEQVEAADALPAAFLRETFTSKQAQQWSQVRLGEVCKTAAGGTPLKSKTDYYKGGEIPWILSGEVEQGEIVEPRNFITKQGLENSSAKIFPINTILIAMYGATAGKVGILKVEASTNQAICGILPNEKFLPKYVYYFSNSIKNELIRKSKGGAQPNISQQAIRNTPILVASIIEQKKIVARLDKQFAAVEKVRLAAKEQLAPIHTLPDSLLRQAFSEDL